MLTMRFSRLCIMAACVVALPTLTACGGAATTGGAHTQTQNADRAPELDAFDESAPEGQAGLELRNAVDLIDAHQGERAIQILERLHRVLPNNGMVLHELGLAYRLTGQPARAVELLVPFEEVLGVTATAALGSAADEAGDTAQAETLLRRGIVRHPRAGLLYSELAVVVAQQRRTDEAIALLIEGMRAEPTWPTNYLHGANLLSDSDTAGLTLYWGEIFRVLEPGSDRSRSMGANMVDVLRRRVTIGPPDASGDAPVSVRLAPGSAQVTRQQGGGLTVPFVHALELGQGTVLATATIDGLTLASLHTARAAFLSSPTPDTELFRWLGALARAGHLEAYDYWLYGPAFQEEASTWANANGASMDALARYLSANPFAPTVSIEPDAPTPLAAGAAESSPAPVPPGAI